MHSGKEEDKNVLGRENNMDPSTEEERHIAFREQEESGDGRGRKL